jgi:hypothetical protein
VRSTAAAHRRKASPYWSRSTSVVGSSSTAGAKLVPQLAQRTPSGLAAPSGTIGRKKRVNQRRAPRCS